MSITTAERKRYRDDYSLLFVLQCDTVCSIIIVRKRQKKRAPFHVLQLVVMIDVNSGTGRLLICGVRFNTYDSIKR